MSEHRVTVAWKLEGDDFSYEGYNRDHQWDLGDGVRVAATAAPEYGGSAGRADPERAYVAALSSCHMLTFLALAARKRTTVESYVDEAVGFLDKDADGRLSITRVRLRPRVVFSGQNQPTREQLQALHERAHALCFIANSVRTAVLVDLE